MMNSTESTSPLLRGENIFRLFKYIIYALLSYNLILFYFEDSTAAAEIYGDGLLIGDIIEAYSATIDTAAWVILLIVFELETATLSDKRLKGWTGRILTVLKAVCYAFILYSLYGYLLKFNLVTSIGSSTIDDLCSVNSQGWSFVSSLNEYFPINNNNCLALGSAPLLQIDGTQILGHREQMTLLYNLSGIDVINAGAWVVLVIVLQMEVMLQLNNLLSTQIMQFTKWAKGVIYLVLFLAAVYWGIDGSFLDFWDAFLWLVAFVFIDLNILSWHEETKEEQSTQA